MEHRALDEAFPVQCARISRICTKLINRLRLLSLLGAVLTTTVSASAPDQYGKWVRHFHETDDIMLFQGYWQQVLDRKQLEDPNSQNWVIGFSSRVIHHHPSLIKGRMDNLNSFPKAARESVSRLLWLSDTQEGRAILRKDGVTEFRRKALPPIGRAKIDTAQDIDFCWGWFYGSGNPAALDPIVSALDYGKYAGAFFEVSKQTTEAGRQQAMKNAIKDAIFGYALSSLYTSAKEDPVVAEHLRLLLDDPQTPSYRKIWLYSIFRKMSQQTSLPVPKQPEARRIH